MPSRDASRSFISGRILATLTILAVLGIAPMVIQWLGEPFFIRVFTRIVIFALAASALNVLLGYGGLVSLMHAALLGVGGYAVAILAQHHFNGEGMPFLGGWRGTEELALSIPLGVLAATLVSLVTGIVSLRTSGTYFIMITLAFNQMIFYFFGALDQYGGYDGMQILGTLTLFGTAISRPVFYYVCWGALAAALLLMGRAIDSRFGTVIRATEQNHARVLAVGVPALRYRLTAFALSGALAGLAGALWAAAQGFMSPADLSWSRSADLVIMVILGGLGVLIGPTIGAALYVILELVLSSWTEFWQLAFGLILIVFVTVQPRARRLLAQQRLGRT